jgi:hypothetical protein
MISISLWSNALASMALSLHAKQLTSPPRRRYESSHYWEEIASGRFTFAAMETISGNDP